MKYKPSKGVEAVDVEKMVLVLEGLDDLGHRRTITTLDKQNKALLLGRQHLHIRHYA